MDIRIIRKEQQNTTNWSGGTTTQLAIYPEKSSYADKTFSFRLSSAKVNIEKSTFTKLEGVSRNIMVLNGELKLTHEKRYSKVLKPFDTDQFLGDWNTKSIGKVTDFNLMTTGKTKGYLSHINILRNDCHKLSLNKEFNTIALYIYKGEAVIEINNNSNILKEQDILILKTENKKIDELRIFNNNSVIESDIIISKIDCVEEQT